MSSHRSIRLFLSSTFRDFGEERDLLVKRVFPALRAKLRDRFVELVDVDLRWGITAEEAERGEVLPICLAEIDRARPYFISMLGERYGWVPPPDGFAADLLERQPWLKKHQGGKSVTELEILHGVLNNRRMKGRAFFYFRSPAYARAKGGDYLPSAEDRARQSELKRRIRERGLPVTSYANPEALAKHIERDLWKLLDAEFPASSVPDSFERERLRHEAYAAPRRRLYLGGERYQAALAKLLEAEEPRIIVEGALGGGKSALLANFFEAYRKRHRRHLVHEHYLGASADAADPHALVRRLIEFIQRATGSTEEIPGDPQKLMDSLPLWLATASAWARKRRTRFIFVLDSLNSLTEQQDLRWWPAFLPKGITMLVSCLPGPVHDALKGKTEALPGQDKPPKWKTVTVRPLTKAQSATLLNTYLARFNKKLPRQMVKQVQAHPLSTNPLFMRTLAEELRLFGVHEELQKRLNHYLTSQTIDDLFERVLQRVEKDCGKKQVKAAMTAIWASRAGLTEKEILDIAQLIPADWAAIRFSIDESLVELSGRINFAHHYLRRAIHDRYLPSPKLKREAHKQIAKSFSDKVTSARTVEELPYQWSAAEAWRQLTLCLTNPEVFAELCDSRPEEEHLNYWLKLESARGRLLIENLLWSAWSRWRLSSDDGWKGSLLNKLVEFLLGSSRGTKSQLNLKLALEARSLNTRVWGELNDETRKSVLNLADIYAESLNYKEAEKLLEKSLLITDQIEGPNSALYSACLNNLGSLQADMGLLDSAEQNYRRALEISEAVNGPYHPATKIRLNNLSLLLLDRGNLTEAISTAERALDISRRVKGEAHPDYGTSLNTLARVNSELGRMDKALVFYRKALDISLDTRGHWHRYTAASMRNLASALYDCGVSKEAEELLAGSLEIQEKIHGDRHPDLIDTLNSLALVMGDRGEFKASESTFTKAFTLAETIYGRVDHPQIAMIFSNLACMLQKKGDYEASEHFHSRSLGIRSSIFGEVHPDTALSLNNIGLLCYARSDLDSATKYLKRALEVYKKVFGLDHPATATVIFNLAAAAEAAEDLASAKDLFRQALAIRERVLPSKHPDIELSLCRLASICKDSGDQLEAENLFSRALNLGEVLYGADDPRLITPLRKLGGLQYELGRLDAALESMGRARDIAVIHQGLEDAETRLILHVLGHLLSDLGRVEEGVEVLQQELKYNRLADGECSASVRSCLRTLGVILRDSGRTDSAQEFLEESLSIAVGLYGETSSKISAELSALGRLRFMQGRLEEAKALLEQGIQLLRSDPDSDPDATARMSTRLEEVLRVIG